MRKFILIVILLLASNNAIADQCAYVNKQTAESAYNILKSSDAFTYFCAPCKYKAPIEKKIKKLEYRLVDYKENDVQFYQIYINGESADIAYIYVGDDNLGLSANCETIVNVPKKLSEYIKLPTAQDYKNDKKKCDANYKSAIKKTEHTWQIRNVQSDKNICYDAIIVKIIKDYYAMPATMDLYIAYKKTMTDIANSIYDNDKECYPSCGTMGIEIGAGEASDFMEFYLNKLLKHIHYIEKQ
jgi:hypothetical protein